MQVAPQDRGKILADSIISWWRDAGVDYLCAEQPVNWLEEQTVQPRAFEEPKRAAPIAPAAVAAVQPARTEWPADFGQLMAAIATDQLLPGNAYSPARAAPIAVIEPKLMVLIDFPEEEDLRAGSLGHGPVGNLLKAMLKACGYDSDEVHIGALAHSRPTSGALPAQDLPLLGSFARHQANIIRPEKLLLLGNSVSEALTGKELMETRGILPDFNQNGGNLAGVITFHPRTLLVRPALKAQAWKDLLRIVKRDQA
jgi:DNA polymerase